MQAQANEKKKYFFHFPFLRSAESNEMVKKMRIPNKPSIPMITHILLIFVY